HPIRRGVLALRASQRASPVHGPLREPYPLRERPDPATRDRSAATHTASTAKPQARSAHAAQRRTRTPGPHLDDPRTVYETRTLRTPGSGRRPTTRALNTRR